MTRTDRIEALATVAAAWRDPDHPPREQAVAAALDGDNRFTEPALAYTLNHWTHAFTPEALNEWVCPDTPDDPQSVGVSHGAAIPADGLREAVAVLGCGHALVAVASADALLRGFLDAVHDVWPGAPIRWVEDAAVLPRETSVIVNQNVQPSGSVIDGNESEDEREGWAEDVLLYEGAPPSVKVVWAPEGLDPDPYFAALAQVRGVVPAHDDTPGALQMQRAFLEAQDAPHAVAEGLSFLVSRGDPEPQPSAHLRWVPYPSLDAVATWIEAHASDWHAIVAREPLHEALPDGLLTPTPGNLHRPSLKDTASRAVIQQIETGVGARREA